MSYEWKKNRHPLSAEAIRLDVIANALVWFVTEALVLHCWMAASICFRLCKQASLAVPDLTRISQSGSRRHRSESEGTYCEDSCFSRHTSRPTTQAQRPGARDATIATARPPPGSLQRMVSPHSARISNTFFLIVAKSLFGSTTPRLACPCRVVSPSAADINSPSR